MKTSVRLFLCVQKDDLETDPLLFWFPVSELMDFQWEHSGHKHINLIRVHQVSCENIYVMQQ